MHYNRRRPDILGAPVRAKTETAFQRSSESGGTLCMHAVPAHAGAALGQQFVTPRTHTTSPEHTSQDPGPELGMIQRKGRGVAEWGRCRGWPVPRVLDAWRRAPAPGMMQGIVSPRPPSGLYGSNSGTPNPYSPPHVPQGAHRRT